MKINGKEFRSHAIPTTNTNILIITTEKGFVACGYLNVDIADKVGDVCAIVTGVKTPEDMLSAKVVAVSKAAGQLGVKKGISGEEALMLIS